MTAYFLTLNMDLIDVTKLLIVLSSSTLLGLIMSGVFVLTHRKTVYDHTFSVTLMILPLVISIIIMLISDNLARAFSLAGVFALVRFRTAIADSRDITYILSAVGIGLATALGYLGFAIVITAFLSLIFFLIYWTKFDRQKSDHAKLKIVIPESLNYVNVFNEVFREFLLSYQLQRVKTTDFGTMFELTYLVKLKHGINQKAFIDELRVRNGNLNITMTSDYVSLMSEF
ncbi:MAG: DUF4956 domain-containing protein [Acholeplasmataceae bacterium]